MGIACYQVRTFCQKSENQLLLKDLDTQTAIFKGSHFYQGPSFWVSSRWLSGDVVFVINCTIIPHTTEAP